MNSTRSDCKIDGQGNHWFKCAKGTVGCPKIHGDRTPHCIACTAGEPCQYHNDRVVEMSRQEYIERYPVQAAHLTGGDR